jgi:putative FmdB family regulatory protein
MATYEYLCLTCEHAFEERRPMTAGRVGTALACPSCGSERVRRRFSFSATTRNADGTAAGELASDGGCCGGSGCGCGS